MHETSLLSTPGQFGSVLLPYLSKNDDEEYCFLKYFGFISISESKIQLAFDHELAKLVL